MNYMLFFYYNRGNFLRKVLNNFSGGELNDVFKVRQQELDLFLYILVKFPIGLYFIY